MKSDFSPQFLAILDKLNRNSPLLAVLAILLISSCGFFYHTIQEPTHTEILCPHLGMKILLQNTTNTDYLESLERFHQDRLARGTSENYTVLYFIKSNRSTQIKGVPSDEMKKCYTRDVHWQYIDASYLVY